MKKILNDNIKSIKIINPLVHKYPIIVSIPHSGEYLTKNMNDKLVDDIVLPNMDWYLPDLYNFLEEMGITVIVNNVSRYVIDPNRNIILNKNEESYTKNFIYTKTTFDKDMYKIKPTYFEIENRIKEYYNPYHNQINVAINEKLKYYNKIYLIDLHSFGKDLSADIILGNNNGESCSNNFIETTNKLLKSVGFRVKNNVSYNGGFITKRYGKNNSNCEALQVELCYQTYIEKRNFFEEEFPKIDKKIYYETQKKLMIFFKELSKEILKM